jgi:oligosaccharide repeat unit polymerase
MLITGKGKKTNIEITKIIKLQKGKIYFFLFVSVFCLVFFILNVIKIVGGLNIARAISYTRQMMLHDDTMPIYLKIPTYIYSVCIILMILINIYYKNINRIILILFYVLFLFYIILLGSKGNLLQIAILSLLILHLKKKKIGKSLLLIIIVFSVFIYILQYNRDNAMKDGAINLFSLLYIYILSPLPAFDQIVTHQVMYDTSFWGGRTFAFVFRILNKLGFQIQRLPNYNIWFYVPWPTNVTTIVGKFYMDFGIIGVIIFGCIYGLFFGMIFKYAFIKHKTFYIVIYCYFFYCIFFQYFGEWLLTFFSLTIQIFFFSFILTTRIRLK